LTRRQRPELAWKNARDCRVQRGDLVVLTWRESSTIGPNDSDEVKAKAGAVLLTPLLGIEIVSVSRKADHSAVATYRVHDDREAQYMAPKLGTTSSPKRSIDPDAPKITDAERRSVHAGWKERRTLAQAEHRRRADLVRAERELLDARVRKPSRVSHLEAKVRTIRRDLSDAA